MRGSTMRDSRMDSAETGEGIEGATVARVTLAVGRLRVSTETRDAAGAHLRLGRSPTDGLDRSLGVRLPPSP
ncbi:hypothetical protein PQJ75_15110 [Rhodoplanes sp. TEM]|uniref:Uncharacterized protein n=1 Tax=Rhodoplanes tepidamans TaxID=200616 RepID=A0ABT5JB85_RHOTP|nr:MULTISPECIES: hypothetical protein [Rhodoplanes]MDC7786945.1 hypothetical protein [Rhodoplanes tepidamans]MDC7985064.1 hypothetical protein [Rhodoplanes sp. TEM]MDQ0355358.1 hypothetical protein [Rhodoplanes tepidamans]